MGGGTAERFKLCIVRGGTAECITLCVVRGGTTERFTMFLGIYRGGGTAELFSVCSGLRGHFRTVYILCSLRARLNDLQCV